MHESEFLTYSAHAMATATPQHTGTRTAQKKHAWLLEPDAQVRGLAVRTPTPHRIHDQEPGRILIPGDRAAGDQSPEQACPRRSGGYAMPTACPVSGHPGTKDRRRSCQRAAGSTYRPDPHGQTTPGYQPHGHAPP